MALQLKNSDGNSKNNNYRNQNSARTVNATDTVKTVNTASEEQKKQSPIETEKERWAKIRAEEEEKVRAEQRVREKKMDQTEALIAAIRAQVEKEKAAKAAEKKANEKAGMNKSSSTASSKPQFRTISPEEMERLEERKRRKAAGLPLDEEPVMQPKPIEEPIPIVQPKPVEQPIPTVQSKTVEQPKAVKTEPTVEVAGGISGGLGGLKGGPSLANPRGNGPTLQNLNPGQETLNSGIKKTGLGIEITEPAKKSMADESTVTLNVEAINAAVEASNKTSEKAANKTIVLDEGSSSWGEQEDASRESNEEAGWISSSTESEKVHTGQPKTDAFVDENGDVVSVIPVRQRPVDKDDVQSAYNIDFDDDDDEVMNFDSAKSAEDAKRKAEEARQRAEESKRRAEEEARRKAEEEARRKAEEEARRKAEEEARRKAEEEARRKAEEEARRKAEEEAKRRAEEEARRKAEEEAKRRAEEEARRKAEEEAKRRAEEEARRKAEEEARRRAEEEARRKAEEEARRRAEEEARRKAEEEAKRRAEEARRKAEEEKRRAEAEARRRAEEEARRKAEEAARRRAEEEAKRRAEEEARRRIEEETRRRAEEARRKAEEEAKRKAEEEARRKAEEEARRKAEEEARRKAEEEARRKAEEEARRKAEEEAKRKAEEEARRKAEEEAKRKAEEEAKRKAEEEAKRKAEEEAKRKAEEEAKRKAEEAARRAERGFVLPVGAEQFLEKYLSVNAISDQIVRTVQDISANPDEPRNIVILGQYGFGTTAIAEDFAKSFYALGICKNKTIAKIKAGALNRTDITGTIGRLQGGCLVIENAGVISNEKLDEIYHLVSNPDNDVVVIMTGQIEMLSKIFKDNVLITAQFRHLIQVHRITDLDVFTIAKEHAYMSGYPCGPEGETQLRRRMQTVESGNLDRVLRIVDNAISKAYNREKTTGEQEHRLYAEDFE